MGTTYTITLQLAESSKSKQEVNELLLVLAANGITAQRNEQDNLALTVKSRRQLYNHTDSDAHLQGSSIETNALEYLSREVYGAMPFFYSQDYRALEFTAVDVKQPGKDSQRLIAPAEANVLSLPDLLNRSHELYHCNVQHRNAVVTERNLAIKSDSLAGRKTILPEPWPNANYRAEWTGPSFAKMLLSTSIYHSPPAKAVRELSEKATPNEKGVATALAFSIAAVVIMGVGLGTFQPWLIFSGAMVLLGGICSGGSVAIGLNATASCRP